MIEATPYLVDKKKEFTSIQFIIRIKGQRLRFVPGITIETKYWIDNNKWCRENKQYPDGYINNIQIKKYKSIIEEVLNEFQQNIIIPTQETFKNAILSKIDTINLENGGIISENKKVEILKLEKSKNLINYIESYNSKSSKGKGTKQTYKTAIRTLKDFENYKKTTLKFQDINMEFYKEFREFLLEKELSKNYIGSIFKNIILFLNDAKEEGLTDWQKPKGFIVEKEDADTIALTECEIKKIQSITFTEDLINKHFPNFKRSNITKKLNSLNLERDRFIIGYCTALRISDYSRIDNYNIEDNLITIWTKKKDKKIYIPIHYFLKNIIDRYNGLSLPKISDQKHNDQLKDICKIVGINDPVRKTITKGGIRIENVEPKYKFVTSHTARRSGATNMYRNGIDLLYISRLLGHSKIEQTVKYLKITTKELALSLKDNPYFKGGSSDNRQDTD